MSGNIPKPEFPPLLASDKHVFSEPELYKIVVDDFSSSVRRLPLWRSLQTFVADLHRLNILPARIWLDGSYLTEKVEPDDIDIILEIENQLYESLSSTSRQFVNGLKTQPFHVEPRCLHTFLVINFPAFHIDHGFFANVKKQWEIDWGQALLSKQPKGIAILEVKR